MRALVSGAGVAGPAAAYWLARIGYDVTVLERADGLRTAGQNVDVRGTAREVLERMGLWEAVKGANTGEVGTRFVDEEGGTVSEFALSADGPTAELEVLRGELSRVLVESCPDEVEWRFGEEIVAAHRGAGADDAAVEVELASGERVRADLLVLAEGASSRTRDLVLPAEERPEQRRIGLQMVYATLERTESDDDWWQWMTVPGGRSASLRPDNLGTTRAFLSWTADPEPERDLMSVLREQFGDLGWEVPRILDAVAADDGVWIDDLFQVVGPVWSRGRVVLLGDTAWCITPVGGGGTSLALVGAYVLAAELSRLEEGAAPAPALAAWEEWMRPLVEKAQHLPPGVPRLAHPHSRLGVALMRTATKVVASPPAQALAAKIGAGPVAEQPLPELVERPA